MELDHENSAAIARSYFGTSAVLHRLGWGISGYVYLSPDAQTAVKVHRRPEGFATELRAYQTLQANGITSLHGLTIPKLRDHRIDLKLIRMDVVSAPYLLDFAGVLFSPPDFSDDVMEHWRARLVAAYGPNAHVADTVYGSLARIGLYYLDFRPSNMNLTGLPGLMPYDPAESDDF
jgi:hypothetical protein